MSYSDDETSLLNPMNPKSFEPRFFEQFDFTNVIKRPENIQILKTTDYEYLTKYKFTLKELKQIIKKFNLQKPRITLKRYMLYYITNCLKLYSLVSKIQKTWRNYFIRKFNKTLGPGFFNREISNNVDDFMTTETVKEIGYYDFFSFKDKDGFVYSFNFVSIYNLISKHIFSNPYNRIEFDESMVQLILKRQNMNKVLNKVHENSYVYAPPPVTYRDRIMKIFSRIDELGNYSNHQWFTHLGRRELCKFLFELYEIWVYRAQLTPEMQLAIVPNTGNPFGSINSSRINYMEYHSTIQQIREVSCTIMETLINSATDDSNQNLGALYILSALTLVSESARESLPWLYSSVQYN